MIASFPILTAAEAAALIEHGQTVGFSGFTPAGAPKAIPLAIAARAIAAHHAGQRVPDRRPDRRLHRPFARWRAGQGAGHQFRTPYQSNADLRDRINAGQTRFFDLHLSLMPQVTRYGFLGPVDCGGGGSRRSHRGRRHRAHLRRGRGAHLLQPGEKRHHRAESPSSAAACWACTTSTSRRIRRYRKQIPIYTPSDRIGSPIITVDPAKIVGVVETGPRGRSARLQRDQPAHRSDRPATWPSSWPRNSPPG